MNLVSNRSEWGLFGSGPSSLRRYSVCGGQPLKLWPDNRP